MKIIFYITTLLLFLPIYGYSADLTCDSSCADKYKDYAKLSISVYGDNQQEGSWIRIKDYKKTFCDINTNTIIDDTIDKTSDHIINNTTRQQQKPTTSSSNKKICTKTDMFNLHISVYQNQLNNQRVIVFSGMKDSNNISNIINFVVSTGIPKQFIEARKYIQELITNDYSYINTIVTGHSLGGSLAQFISKSFGMRAVTFTPAGLNGTSLRNAEQHYNKNFYDIFRNKEIINIIAKNNHLYLEGYHLPGKKISLMVNKKTIVDLHNMKNQYRALIKEAGNLKEIDKINYIFDYLEDKYSVFRPKASTKIEESNDQQNSNIRYYRNYQLTTQSPLFFITAINKSIHTNYNFEQTSGNPRTYYTIVNSIDDFYKKITTP